MLQQMISRTPLWVWGLLAFLVYRGLLASVNRETSLKKAFIIPAVMLVLSLQSVFTTFAGSTIALASWFGFMLAGSFLSWSFSNPQSIVANPQRGVVLQQGSWVPLMLMMGIFFTKYGVNVTLAVNAGFEQEIVFVTSVCALYGLFNGIFVGKLLRIVSMYRATASSMLPRLELTRLEPTLVKQSNML